MSIESLTHQIGRDLLKSARLLGDDDASWLDQRLMRWGMRDERLTARMFRFVDALPSLRTDRHTASLLAQYLSPGLHPGRLTSPPIARLARWGVHRMARRFIAATTIQEAKQTLQRLRDAGMAFTIDVLGEAVLSDSEAAQYQQRYLDLLSQLAPFTAAWPENPRIDRDHRSAIPRLNVSVKLSALVADFNPVDPDATSRRVRERLRPILRLARDLGTFVNIDMEHRFFKDATLQVFRDVLEEHDFRDWPDVGIAMQSYLRETAEDLQQLHRWAERRGAPVWVRIVKGAYWDYETTIAAQENWAVPVFTRKPETDANFEALTDFLLERHDVLRPAIASHNIRSIAHALAVAEASNLPDGGIEFQSLYGMAGAIRRALVALDQRVRVYTPMGELLPGMAYLVRRLLENTSNESFLGAGFFDSQPEETLLMNPLQLLRPRPTAASPKAFMNEPLSDFSRERSRLEMRDALAQLRREPVRIHPLIVGGRSIATERTIDSPNPSHRREIAGRTACATAEHAPQAIAAARAAFPAWRDRSAEDRAALLQRSAALLRRRRFELAALEVIECGKPWPEADGDVAEAIDYCEFYAREALRLAQPTRANLPGEENACFYEPRGVAVIIAPWNFPLAILCGMTTAALVMGNTAIMKPAEQSPEIAARLMEVFTAAGFPPGVVNFLPGVGEEIGPLLVAHPDVDLIAFTGSRTVGLAIQRQASETPPGQTHVKRVITEMGGKNAIIIDDTADLDEAVAGVLASAFGYAGQKCSACSRAIVLNSIKQTFTDRLIESTRSLHIGHAEDPATFMGPLIDDEARQRVLAWIEKGKSQAPLAYAGDIGPLAEEGFFVGPHIFDDVPPDAPLAQEEIFGPVLSILRARDLDEALAIANNTQYALTGGIYSRSPAAIDRATREFRVGNLYINRKITGALVGRQPFGGHRLSGTGPKAGGSDYLPHFAIARCVTENTLRHGFAPPGE